MMPSDKPAKPVLYLLCGLPCAGKTTFASQLAQEKQAIKFSLDHLVLALFREEDSPATHRHYVQRVTTVFYPIVQQLLTQGCSVVMDFPAHTKTERDELRHLAEQTQAEVKLYYLSADLETISNRIQRRNADLKDGEYFISDSLLTMIVEKFEPPDRTEHPIEVHLQW